MEERPWWALGRPVAEHVFACAHLTLPAAIPILIFSPSSLVFVLI
jgi:hypothetical protein